MDNIIINPKYEPLFTTDCSITIMVGGRGSAKSFSVATFVTNLTTEPDHVVLFSRYTMVSARDSIIPEFEDKIERMGMLDAFDIAQRDVINKQSGSRVIFRGIKTSSGNQTAKLKSIKGLTTFVVDEAEEFIDENAFDTIHYSIRKKGIRNRVIIVLNSGYKTHWIYKRFFKGQNIPDEFNGEKNGVCYIHTTYLDNLDNLSNEFIAEAEKVKRTNPKKYKHKFLSHWADESENALWKQSLMIDPFRIFELPDLRRSVVGVDPSVSNTGNQDEAGIVTCGMDYKSPPHFYVYRDASGVLTTKEWSRIAVAEYKNSMSDRIVPEVNNGGELVVDSLKNIDSSLPVRAVRASRGKMTRAEPIAGLYEEGRVHHVGYLPELEEQLTTFDGTGASPGRYDACVWALTDLSQHTNEVGIRAL